MNPEIKKELSKFIHHARALHKRFENHQKNISDYVKKYKIPSLEGYDEIESIFPKEQSDVKTVQQPLSEYY